jgi:hypothetical protein
VIFIPSASGQFSFTADQFRFGEIRSRAFSGILSNIYFSPNTFCHHFCQIQYFNIVAFRVVCGVANHDWTIRARDNYRRRPRFRKLRKSKLVHPALVLASGIVRNE